MAKFLLILEDEPRVEPLQHKGNMLQFVSIHLVFAANDEVDELHEHTGARLFALTCPLLQILTHLAHGLFLGQHDSQLDYQLLQLQYLLLVHLLLANLDLACVQLVLGTQMQHILMQLLNLRFKLALLVLTLILNKLKLRRKLPH